MPTVSRGLYRWLFRGGATLGDLADRLNHVWTFGLLLVFGGIISWKHGYSEPMSCWCPAEFTPSMVDYTVSRAWHTYSILYPEALDKANLSHYRSHFTIPVLRENESVDQYRYIYHTITRVLTELFTPTYYQWVPLILCLQALLFKLPNLLMYILHHYSGINFDKLSGLTSGYNNLNLEEREHLSRQVARYVQVWCKSSPLAGVLPWRLLTVVWLGVKVLYVVNVITQLTLVDKFLSTADVDNATSYGDVIYDNLENDNASYWRQSPVFPRLVTFDFSIRQLRNIQRYTVQCTIPGNYFAEHAYMFLWVWLVFVAVVTTASLLVWIVRTLVPVFRRRYVRKYLDMAAGEGGGIPTSGADRLADSLLGEDGVMVLKMVAENSSDLLVMQVVNQLWRMNVQPTVGVAAPTAGPSVQTAPWQPAMSTVAEPGEITGGIPMQEVSVEPNAPLMEKSPFP